MSYCLSSVMVIYLQKIKIGVKGEHFHITASKDIICLNVSAKQSLLYTLFTSKSVQWVSWVAGEGGEYPTALAARGGSQRAPAESGEAGTAGLCVLRVSFLRQASIKQISMFIEGVLWHRGTQTFETGIELEQKSLRHPKLT